MEQDYFRMGSVALKEAATAGDEKAQAEIARRKEKKTQKKDPQTLPPAARITPLQEALSHVEAIHQLLPALEVSEVTILEVREILGELTRTLLEVEEDES